MTLHNRAKAVDPKAIVAQRLKRLSSIKGKLERFGNMQLARVQDLGGCRAIVRTVSVVDKLVSIYEDNPPPHAVFEKKNDYIATPKTDGYRGVHLIYKYQNDAPAKLPYTNLRIEIQLRSRLQHAWATALETVSTFTGQALKANLGDDAWKRFFLLMGSAIAIREKRPVVAGAPDKAELVKALRESSNKLNVQQVLLGWGHAIHEMVPKIRASATYLLKLDMEANTIRVEGYTKRELLQASDAYLQFEKETAGNPKKQGVLVSVNSLQALRSAYPNYFADTEQFVRALNEAIL